MAVFLILAYRGAVVEKDWTGALIGIASMAPVAAMMHLACKYDTWHLLGFHIAPVLLLAMLGLYLSRRLLKI